MQKWAYICTFTVIYFSRPSESLVIFCKLFIMLPILKCCFKIYSYKSKGKNNKLKYKLFRKRIWGFGQKISGSKTLVEVLITMVGKVRSFSKKTWLLQLDFALLVLPLFWCRERKLPATGLKIWQNGLYWKLV